MATKITTDCVEAYLRCKTKAHLKSLGEQGTNSEYGLLLAEMKSETKRTMIEWILSRHNEGTVLKDVSVTAAELSRAMTFVLGATIEDDMFCLTFDGLKRAPGESRLGEYHYIPVLFHPGEKVRLEERLLLAVLGTVLGDLQGRQPGAGIVYFGPERRGARIQLNEKLRERGRRILREVKDLRARDASPKLMLNSHCPACEFRRRCREEAEKDDDLSLLSGMGEREILKLNRKGICTVAQLSCTFRLRKRGKRVRRQTQPHYFALQAAAIRDKRIYVLKPSPLPASQVRIYLDVEGNVERGFVYLIGMLIVENGNESWCSFWADSKDDERAIFRQMLETIKKYDEFTIIYYGSYETSFLKRMRKEVGQKAAVTTILARSVNLLSIIYSHIYFPVSSNSLKMVGRYLGCTWTDPDASGLKSLVLRSRWEKSRDETLRRDLETYNREDCLALRRVADLVYLIGEASSREGGSPPTDWGGYAVAAAADINPIMSRPEFRRPGFALPDLEVVNKCAYFDYQREKVFLRTSAVIRAAHARSKREGRTRRPRINRTIEVRSRKCPHCGGTSLVRYGDKTHTKIAYDLTVSETGIRRLIIACTAALHRCRTCSKTFLPPRYKRRDKHFHSLKSWAMYHHIAHRISFENLEAIISECFGFHVDHVEIHQFKSILAKYYRATYQQILSRIVFGEILHADETHVNFQKGKGYVWVLTNMEDVIYVYRPTRDGDWLQGLLAGFKGVLISDFFSAYDSLPCEQQKCLIHLIRDMNEDLLSSPYDTQFKDLVSQFGSLLRKIVSTIDEYGLRERHLRKHIRDVDRFYRDLEGRSFSSELANDYSRRLTKYRDKLFTFLRHDGVPWNNNNAEHAIKSFAEYRITSDGQMTAPGLRDYLVLLSIYETCKYRGIGFLRFLLSQERDLDKFRDSARATYSSTSLQVYPKGFYNYPRKAKRLPDEPFFPHG